MKQQIKTSPVPHWITPGERHFSATAGVLAVDRHHFSSSLSGTEGQIRIKIVHFPLLLFPAKDLLEFMFGDKLTQIGDEERRTGRISHSGANTARLR